MTGDVVRIGWWHKDASSGFILEDLFLDLVTWELELLTSMSPDWLRSLSSTGYLIVVGSESRRTLPTLVQGWLRFKVTHMEGGGLKYYLFEKFRAYLSKNIKIHEILIIFDVFGHKS